MPKRTSRKRSSSKVTKDPEEHNLNKRVKTKKDIDVFV